MHEDEMLALLAEEWHGEGRAWRLVSRSEYWVVVELTTASSPRTATLHWGPDELCFLEVAGCVHHEFAYEEDDKVEAVREQLARAAEYLAGRARYWETSLGGRVVRRSVVFPDGERASWQLPWRQRLAARAKARGGRATDAEVESP